MSSPSALTAAVDIINCSIAELIQATDQQILDKLTLRNQQPEGTNHTRNNLLLAAVQARETAKENPHMQSPEGAMKRLLAITVDEISSESVNQPAVLRDLMICAHKFGPSLPQPPTAIDATQLASSIMVWKLKSLEALQSNTNYLHPEASLLPDAPSPPADLLNLDDLLRNRDTDPTGTPPKGDNTSSPPRKKLKAPVAVGGIQIVDDIGKSAPNCPLRIGPYPTRSSVKPQLCVTELLGSKLLLALLQKGRCLESAIAEVNWHRGQKGELLAAEAEAFFLARILHFALQDYENMETALETCSWMEVAIRRLYALIYVENAMRTMNTSRATAWTAGSIILESNPGTPALLPEFDNSLARTLAMNAKAHNAFKSMKGIQMRGNRPPRRDRPESAKDAHHQ